MRTRTALTVIAATLVAGTALLVWHSRGVSDQPTAGADRSPGIGVAPGSDRIAMSFAAGAEPEPAVTYTAELHQRILSKPSRWCAERRADEPLLREARLLASGDDPDFSTTRSLLHLPSLSPHDVHVVTDEAGCEAAARTFDSVVYSGAVTVETHTSLRPVLVVRVGTVSLIDDLRDRGMVWDVIIVDRQWQFRFHYGGGA